MRNSILWYQNPKNEGDDFIYINGKSITPPSDPVYIKSFDKLLNIVKNKKEHTIGNSSIYKAQNGFLLKDSFEDKDNLGRPMSFLYFFETNDIDSFTRSLMSDINATGHTYNIKEKQIIIKRLSKKPIIANVIIGLVILLIVTYLITKYYG